MATRTMDAPHHPGESRLLTVVAACLVAAFFGLRLPLLLTDRFNPDEFEHLHAAFSLSSGLVPYRDFFENHFPLLQFMLAPLFAVFAADRSAGQAEALILAARVGMAGLSGLTIVTTYWLGRIRAGRRQGLAAAVLLCGLGFFADKGFEIRPDVPALLLLNVTWLSLAAAWRPDPRGLRRPWLAASGASLALATLCTQKILFLWPAVGVVMGWMTLEARGPRVRALLAWLAGFVGVTAAIGGWFAARGALAAFVDQNLLLNLRWQTRYPPLPPLRAILIENLPLVLLALAGAVTAARGVDRIAPASLRWLPVAAAAAVVTGAFIVPAPLEQYFLPLAPPLAWLAADALAALVRWRGSGRSAEWLLVGVLALLLLQPLLGLARGLRNPGDWARTTIAQVRWVLDNTKADDSVLDGFSGAGVFRPHAWFYFYPNEDIAPLIRDEEVAALIRDLRDGEISPRLAVLDRDLRRLDAELLEFLEANYEPTGVGDIWARRDQPIDQPPFEGRLDVGAGPTDRLVGTGFYRPQQEAGRWFRLSRGPSSTLRVPLARGDHARLVLHARLEFQGRPVAVAVTVNDREIGRAVLGPGWRGYVFTLPPTLLRPGLNRVRLSYTSTPRDEVGSGGRNAVIALDEIRLE